MRLSRIDGTSQTVICCWFLLFFTTMANASPAITMTSPMPHQVIQRTGFRPTDAHANQKGGSVLGNADVVIRGSISEFDWRVVEARIIRLRDLFGIANWKQVAIRTHARAFEGNLTVPAGGWYRLEVRATGGTGQVTGSVEPIGVGDLFVIAGQSYACNDNDELKRVADAEERIVCYDWERLFWRVAHDPQPNTTGTGGSIWPETMDFLLPPTRVPLGMVNVAIGGTRVNEWMPGTISVNFDNQRRNLFENLTRAGKAVGLFRAVLWQQGESDVIADTSAEDYKESLKRVADESARQWGFRPIWLIAKSTYHPTVYNKPEQEGVIRAAIEQLGKEPGFRPGPDTDILGGIGVYRGAKGSQQHFTALGQRMAALLWFAAIWQELQDDEH